VASIGVVREAGWGWIPASGGPIDGR
jgi:hypothetical protein